MPGEDTFRIVLADDHSLIRHGIKNLIKKHGQLQVVGEVSDGEELLIAIEKVLNGKKYISPTLTDNVTDDVFRMHRDGLDPVSCVF